MVVEKKFVMWRKIFHVTDCHVEKFLHITNRQSVKRLHMVNKEKIMSCGEMWSKICHVETFLHVINVEIYLFRHNLCCFVAIYTVLKRNLFCRDLRAFVWRKNYSEIVLVKKKGQI